MRSPLLTILLMVPLAGCTLGTRKQAATPAPPQPTAVQPPAPEAPLSIPQTAVTLPPEQKFNPESIPKVQVAEETPVPEKPEVTPAPTRAARPRSAAGTSAPSTAKADTDADVETPAPPVQAVTEQAPIQPILGGEEQKKIKGIIEGRKREISDRMNRAKAHLSPHDKSLVDRIESFLQQCEQAEQRGDYSQADSLSERAVVLAQELSE